MLSLKKVGLTGLIAAGLMASTFSTSAHAGKKERAIALGIFAAIAGVAIISSQSNKARAHSRPQGYRSQNNAIQVGQRTYIPPSVAGTDTYQNDNYGSHQAPRIEHNDYYDEDRSYREEKRARRQHRRARADRRARRNNRQNSWQRHVRRCSKKYRTYDPRTDTFIGYDGYEHVCKL